MVNTDGFNPTTGEWNDSLTGDFIWSNTNIGEAFSDVMTPFTWSLVGALYDELNVLPGYSTAGNIGGRAYQNGSVMYATLLAMGRRPADMTEIGGRMELPAAMTIPEFKLPRLAFFPVLFNTLRLMFRMGKWLRGLPAFIAENPRWCEVALARVATIETREAALAFTTEETQRRTEAFWRLVSITWRYSDAVAPLRRDLAALAGDDDASALLAGVNRAAEMLASLGPVVGLSRVARGEMDRETFLRQYGHRGPHEAEVSAPRPAEDPAWLEDQLAAWAAAPVDVDRLLAEQEAKTRAAWLRLAERHPDKASALRRRLETVAGIARQREAMRSELTRLVWVMRAWCLRAGQLSGVGDGIFFLTYDEARDLLAGKAVPTETIPARRATFDRYRRLPAYPPLICGRFDPVRWAADPHRRGDFYDSHLTSPSPAGGAGLSDVIRGLPGSAGRVEGIVRRLDRPEDGDQLRPGEILVTSQTNVGWTLLFPRAAAVVTDVGAALSHAAIVARELGIPAVVGCGNATTRLKTGDRVRVDGGAGIVEIGTR
jgi:pyruvate,water dikinase